LISGNSTYIYIELLSMVENYKDFIAASLIPLVLIILTESENYGYELIQQLKSRSEAKLNIAEGTLYPVLKKMEEKNWLASKWKNAESGKQRKYYSITQKGKKQLFEQLEQWSFFNNLIQKSWKQSTLTFNMK
jgi:PadR family transcriptional regulator PadR